jgi:hypothetical protein
MIWRRVSVYITPNADNRAINIIAPPRDMLRFAIGGAVGRPLLMTSHMKVLGTAGGNGPHSYYFYGYISKLLYSFKFDTHRTINNVILADPVQGSLHIKVEGILQGDNLPSNGVTTWTWFQREDALTRNGGGDVTRLMEGPGPHANGPSEAQTRALGPMRTRGTVHRAL